MNFFKCCLTAKAKQSPLKTQSKYYKDIIMKLKNQEINILQLIFNDLAERHPKKKIDQQNFLIFFHLNGMWGQMLFQSFNLDQSKLMDFQEFVNGISKYIKANQTQKILTLFNFIQGESLQGIGYNSFTKMLYHYPKQDLKKIINTKDFFQNQILKHIKNITSLNQLQQQQSINSNNLKSKKQQAVKKKQDQTIKNKFVQIQYQQSIKNLQISEQKKSETHFEKAYRNIIKYKDPGTSLQFKIQNKTYQVKSVNINTLIKRFAAKIYNDYDINLKNGKLKVDQFKDWLSKHPELYNNYYTSFHNYIWQAKNSLQLYKITPTEKQSEAYFQRQPNLFQEVYLLLIHTTIVICKDNTKSFPLKIICLQGLCVNAIKKQNKFGMQISHRDGLYQNKTIVFNKKQLQQQWLQCLKFFKGSSIQQKYTFFEKIGAGKFSIVYRCAKNNSKQKKDKNTQSEQYAIKVIQTYKLSPQQKNYLAHQSGIMTILNHPNIIKLIQSFQTKTHLYIITQLVKGVDLFDYVTMNKDPIRQYQSALIIGQILQAVKYLHGLGLIHSDLKPQNIMVFLKNSNLQAIQRIKLIDFGFSNYINILKENKKLEIAGTLNYIAPQTLQRGIIDYKSDIFAIGVIMYFILRGRLPFDSNYSEQILINTMACQYNLDDYIWATVSQSAKNLIQRFLTKKPEDRISIQQALNHEWFTIQNKQQKRKHIKDPFAF